MLFDSLQIFHNILVGLLKGPWHACDKMRDKSKYEMGQKGWQLNFLSLILDIGKPPGWIDHKPRKVHKDCI